MSHRLYHTEAFVLNCRPFGEANAWYYLLTPDFGLVVAAAQGVRELKSKLRGQLTSRAHLLVSLVRGRGGWLITAAENSGLLPPRPESFEEQATLIRISRLLYRLVRGEERNPVLFDELKWGLVRIIAQRLPPARLYHHELILVLKLLWRLGYVSPPQTLSSPTAGPAALVRLINRALHASQL